MKHPLPLVCLFVSFVAGAAAWAGDVAPAQPVIPAHTVQLTDFNAVPDGRTVNTSAFRHAVAAVERAGGGTLVVPAGRWLTQPFELTSGLNLHLEAGATILFTTDPADSLIAVGRFRPFLLTTGAHDVMISGAGTIDGQGQAWWPEAVKFRDEANRNHARSNTSPRPRLVVFERCQRVRVEGVTLTNAPVFNLVPVRCEDVTIEGVTILNPADSPNTDGIDPSVSQRVLIVRCHIDTGDDCIAVKAGSAGAGVMQDLLITDCTFGHGHGCSIGSETSSGLRNMVVRRCTFDGTEIGVRFKSDRRRGGLVENVTYTDLTMKNVGRAIVISSYYQGSTSDMPAPGEHDRAQAVTATTPHWRNIAVRNLTATGCTKDAGLILGLPEMPAENITLENVTIEAPAGLRLGYAKDVALRHVQITAAKGEPVITDDTVENLTRSD
jgi:polygalacturonase